MSDTEEKKVSIEVPEVSSDEVNEATDLVESIAAKYEMDEKDVNVMFNAMIAIYLRNRIVYGDRGPKVCGASGAVDEKD